MRRLAGAAFWLVVVGWLGLAALVLFATFGVSEPPTRGFGAAALSTASAPGAPSTPGDAAPFSVIATVLQSPRCVNCHPVGDRPLAPDGSGFHRMNVSRVSVDNGLQCSACHKAQNSEALGIAGGPPGAPHWGLPPKDTPMIFEGRSEQQLCRQLNTPSETGGRDLEALLEHVSSDALVLWAWNPGGTREPPPYSHEAFVAAFQAWVASGGSCVGTSDAP